MTDPMKLADELEACALYNFDSVEMVECKHALWKRVSAYIRASALPQAGPIYVASRASLPERSAMWRALRNEGWQITSSWIDEAGEGETADFTQLWDRIMREIATANKLVLYAETDDFPLKGALIEAGIALGMGKPVVVCLPGVKLDGRTKRPIGSWLAHRNAVRCDSLFDAMAYPALSQQGDNRSAPEGKS